MKPDELDSALGGLTRDQLVQALELSAAAYRERARSRHAKPNDATMAELLFSAVDQLRNPE
jgi:hypothetical protein